MLPDSFDSLVRSALVWLATNDVRGLAYPCVPATLVLKA